MRLHLCPAPTWNHIQGVSTPRGPEQEQCGGEREAGLAGSHESTSHFIRQNSSLVSHGGSKTAKKRFRKNPFVQETPITAASLPGDFQKLLVMGLAYNLHAAWTPERLKT